MMPQSTCAALNPPRVELNPPIRPLAILVMRRNAWSRSCSVRGVPISLGCSVVYPNKAVRIDVRDADDHSVSTLEQAASPVMSDPVITEKPSMSRVRSIMERKPSSSPLVSFTPAMTPSFASSTVSSAGIFTPVETGMS